MFKIVLRCATPMIFCPTSQSMFISGRVVGLTTGHEKVCEGCKVTTNTLLPQSRLKLCQVIRKWHYYWQCVAQCDNLPSCTRTGLAEFKHEYKVAIVEVRVRTICTAVVLYISACRFTSNDHMGTECVSGVSHVPHPKRADPRAPHFMTLLLMCPMSGVERRNSALHVRKGRVSMGRDNSLQVQITNMTRFQKKSNRVGEGCVRYFSYFLYMVFAQSWMLLFEKNFNNFKITRLSWQKAA